MVSEPPQAESVSLALAITELAVAGAERCLVNLAVGLKDRRFSPVVYSLASRPPTGQSALVDELEDSGIPTHFLGVRHPWQSIAAVRRLRALLMSQSPRVFQTFLFHANVIGSLAVRPVRGCRIFAGLRVAEPAGWRWFLQRSLQNRIAKYVCVSEAVARYAESSAGLPNEKLAVIPNGIDVVKFSSAPASSLKELGIPPNRPVIVCVARLDRQKGIDRLLRLTPQLLTELPEHHLLLVGDGPESRGLQQQANSLNVAARIHFAGFQTDVPSILKASQLFVLPSRWEGMPNAMAEAMASGLPVVACEVEGVGELLGSLADEQSVRPQDDAEFVRKVVHLAGNPDRVALLGKQNQQRIREKFSLDAMITAYEQLYRSEIDSPSVQLKSPGKK